MAALALFGNMVVGGMRFWPVVSKVFRKHGLSWTVAGLTASEIYDVVKAQAPESNDADIQEVANQLGRMVDEDEVLWPTDRQGNKINPRYFTVNLAQGNAWFHTDYFSRKSMDGARRAGASRGRRSGERQLSRRTSIYRGT